MPNFSEDKTGFNLDNPMKNVTGVKGTSDEMPGGVSQYSDTPSPEAKKVESKNGSPLPFFKKMFKRVKNVAKSATGGVPQHGPEAHTGGGGGAAQAAPAVAAPAVAAPAAAPEAAAPAEEEVVGQ